METEEGMEEAMTESNWLEIGVILLILLVGGGLWFYLSRKLRHLESFDVLELPEEEKDNPHIPLNSGGEENETSDR